MGEKEDRVNEIAMSWIPKILQVIVNAPAMQVYEVGARHTHTDGSIYTVKEIREVYAYTNHFVYIIDETDQIRVIVMNSPVTLFREVKPDAGTGL